MLSVNKYIAKDLCLIPALIAVGLPDKTKGSL